MSQGSSSRPLRRRGAQRGARRPSSEPASAELRFKEPIRFVSAVYEVSVEAGQVTAFEPLVEPPLHAANRCHESLFGSPQPCKGCPAIAARRASTRAEPAVLGAPGASYRLAVAEPLGGGRFRMHVMQLSETMVSALSRARIDRRAQRAGLSTRERAVLELLLLGQTYNDISSALGITERTTRFHVANVLAKLGVESRADLFRLLT